MIDTVAILDDEPDRLAAMVPILQHQYSKLNVVTFDNAPDMQAWFRENLTTCVLICLDHDLGPNRRRDGKVFDPGIGRDVAEYLAMQPPVCPILIHTTNTHARPGMLLVLEDGGWKVTYVSPYDDVLWIREVWTEAVAEVLG